MCNEIVGVNGDEGTPVPIPNTAVKLFRVDDTWTVASWKIISMPAYVLTDSKESVKSS